MNIYSGFGSSINTKLNESIYPPERLQEDLQWKYDYTKALIDMGMDTVEIYSENYRISDYKFIKL